MRNSGTCKQVEIESLNNTLQNILNESRSTDSNNRVYESEESENEENLEIDDCSGISELESDLEVMTLNV